MNPPAAPVDATAATDLVESRASSNTPAHQVAAHYAAVFETQLSALGALVPPGPPPALHAAYLLGRASTVGWADLRLALRESFSSPEYIFGPRSPEHIARKCAYHVVVALQRLGPDKLARDIVEVERAAVAAQPGEEARDGVWLGAAELLAWVRATKRVLSQPASGTNGPASATTPKSVQPAAPVPTASAVRAPDPPSLGSHTESASPAPAASGSSFGFAPPPAPGTLAKKLEDKKKKARLSSAPSASPSAESVPTTAVDPAKSPEALTATTGLASGAPIASTAESTSSDTAPLSAPSASHSSQSSATTSIAAPSSERIEPVAYTSTAPPVSLPTGPPSAGFAPPAAPGTAFEKPAKARKPRASSSTPAPAAGAASEARPTRKRRAPLKLTAEQDSDEDDDWDDAASSGTGGKGARRGKRRSSVAASAGAAKKRRSDPLDGVKDESEVDELASDYEEQVERKAKAERERQVSKEREEEANRHRFPVGSSVMVKFPNYNWWCAVVLDPATAPAETQGKRVKGAYLVKSIPTGGDHRWVAPDDGSILAIQPTQLDDILLGRYKSPPPQSWVKWRSELVEAVMLIKNPERLAEWLKHPTDLELQLAAKAERKRAARAAW